MPIPFCPASHEKFEVHCDELEGHPPIDVNGLKWEHYNHTVGRGWNADGTYVSGAPSPRSWDNELAEALPAWTCFAPKQLGMGAGWAWTTPRTAWSVQRVFVFAGGTRVEIRGEGVSVDLGNPSVQTVIDTLRLHGALDDPAITGVSWEARRFLADQLEAYALECAYRLGRDITTHEEAHLNGMGAGVAWLRGELGLPVSDRTGLTRPCLGGCGDDDPHNAHLAPGALERLESGPRREVVVMAELMRDAWALISKAHGGQPWEAHGEWRDKATEWRDSYRLNNPSAGLVEAARDLIMSVVGNQGEAWEEPAYAWRKRYGAWLAARS